jgi:hypothetical protein
MPFSGKKSTRRTTAYCTRFFKSYLLPTLEELGYECECSVASARSIVGTIVTDLFEADLVLAILTDFNPNVFYELGVRHSLAHGTIMAIEKSQRIPFDLSHFGVIYYDDAKRAQFRKKLAKVIHDVRQRTAADSPVGEFLSRHPVGVARVCRQRL